MDHALSYALVHLQLYVHFLPIVVQYELGDCPAYKLFDSVEVKRKDDVEYPRKYQDYEVYINRENIPDSVEVKQMI